MLQNQFRGKHQCEDDSFKGFIEDQDATSPADHKHRLLKEQLEGVLDTLTDRENVLCTLVRRWSDANAREVGKVFGVRVNVLSIKQRL